MNGQKNILFAAGLTLILSIPFAAGQITTVQFQRLTNEDGLSQNYVQSICQDSAGFLWFGTRNGLNRYDGYEFISFVPDPPDPSGFNISVTALCRESDSTLWVGTENGLYLFNLITECFQPRPIPGPLPAKVHTCRIHAVARGRDETMWIATNCGLFRSTPPADTLTSVPLLMPSKEPLTTEVTSLYVDDGNRIWVGSREKGLFVCDTAGSVLGCSPDPAVLDALGTTEAINAVMPSRTGTVWLGTDRGLVPVTAACSEDSRRISLSRRAAVLPESTINALAEDASGRIWIGTDQGIAMYSPGVRELTRIKADPLDNRGLTHNVVTSILFGRTGEVWVGTWGGISKTDFMHKPFAYLKAQPPGERGSGAVVRSVVEDARGQIWIGTDAGLNRFDRATGRYTRYGRALQSMNVFSLFADHRGAIWAGTETGIDIIRPDTGSNTHFSHSPGDTASLTPGIVRTIFADSRERIWIGTEGGLNLWLPRRRAFKHITQGPGLNELSSRDVYSIVEDGLGRLWIGTWNGLNRLDPETGAITRYLHEPGNPNSLTNNVARVLHRDAAGIIWIGTRGGGVNRFDPVTGTFSSLRQVQGLADNWIASIESDASGILWIGTNNGLTRYDPASGISHNYYRRDGLQGNEFMVGASCRSSGGGLLFGGIDGLTIFDPETIGYADTLPPVRITNMKILDARQNTRHYHGVYAAKEEGFDTVPIIRPGHDARVFTIEFSALHFDNPRNVHYEYRMEHLDDNWHMLGNLNSMTFSHLPPGRYTFQVKSSLNRRTWSRPQQLVRLVIRPRFWQTGFFRICAGIGGLLFLAGFIRIHSSRLKRRNRNLQTLIEKRTKQLTLLNEQLTGELERRSHVEDRLQTYTESLEKTVKEKTAEVIQLQQKKFRMEKLAAFGKATSTIVHEIRNPLTSIKMSLTALTRRLQLDARDQQCLEVAITEVIRLERMLRDMLDFTKPLILRFAPQQVEDVITHVLRILENELAAGHVTVTFAKGKKLPAVKMDIDRISQVMTNLIINSLQAMPSGGQITIKTGEDPVRKRVSITIIDSGIGIQTEDIEHLFEPFFTSKPSGTGLGLTVAHKIITAHSGSIDITSEQNRGTTVLLTLPLDPYLEKTCLNDLTLTL
ncbi:hypothetical protein JXO52_15270 [bacterium]|nr:hypothetical protein [bacterium]